MDDIKQITYYREQMISSDQVYYRNDYCLFTMYITCWNELFVIVVILHVLDVCVIGQSISAPFSLCTLCMCTKEAMKYNEMFTMSFCYFFYNFCMVHCFDAWLAGHIFWTVSLNCHKPYSSVRKFLLSVRPSLPILGSRWRFSVQCNNYVLMDIHTP